MAIKVEIVSSKNTTKHTPVWSIGDKWVIPRDGIEYGNFIQFAIITPENQEPRLCYRLLKYKESKFNMVRKASKGKEGLRVNIELLKVLIKHNIVEEGTKIAYAESGDTFKIEDSTWTVLNIIDTKAKS